MPTPLRVLLADVESSARRAVAALLHSLDGVALVGEVSALDEVGPELLRTGADVLVIDDRLLRSMDNLLAVSEPLGAPIRAVVLGVDDDPAFAARARDLGADAWVAKDRAGDELPALLLRL